VAFWQHNKRVLGICSLRMHRNAYLRTSSRKCDPAIRSGDLDFLQDRCISTTEWHLRDIFDVFVLLHCMTLWHWPLTFWLWECFTYSASHARPTYQFLLSYDYRLLSYELLKLISFPLTGTVIAHAPCHVTYHLGAKMVHISKIPDPNLPIHFVTFRMLRRRLSHVICKKIAFIQLSRLQSLLRMRSITWPVHRRSPKSTRNNFLIPNCLFTIQLLCGYHDD